MIKVKAFIGSVTVAGVLVLAACSKSDSPTAPRPSPTPSAATLTLTVESTPAYVGDVLSARAEVRVGGNAVPDGTPVLFSLRGNLCWYDLNNDNQVQDNEILPCTLFVENSTTSITKTTVAGIARVTFQSAAQDDVELSARYGPANDVKRFTVQGNPNAIVPAATAPRIFQLDPPVGNGKGGEYVTIVGDSLCSYYTAAGNCVQPGSVRFDIGAPVNATRDAPVVAASARGDRLVVLTPQPSPNPLTQDALVSVVVTTLAGSATATNAFRFSAQQLPPLIYSLQPSSGSARGGEVVTIYGANFEEPIKVEFSPGGVAQVVDVPPGGTQITVVTPQNSLPLDADTSASVTVTSLFGTGRDQTVTKANAFTFKAEVTTPVLYALSPNSGPIEGGTRVTIFGSGFQYPVQVLFGDREAQVISSNFNEIVCIAPSIAPSQPGTPTTVQVSVKNILTGKTSSNTLPYRYGEAMFVSAITPNTGYILGWNPATIYGQGFVAPVQVLVTVGGITKEAQVLSVSGTSIQVKMPPFAEAVGDQGCTPVAATFTVTNIGSNLTATGPVYTYLCSGGISGP
uniref:Hypothetical conserved protein n=1 Tax=uncultured prokaryote TaxID=198431 RepID=H5SKW1_9ZZZZ|nr:hypothetical conserved protein [uncultured prokaryote]